MTRIDFYTRAPDRLAIAARLVRKAYAAYRQVRVLTPDATMTSALDRMLWLVPPTGFYPHSRVDSPCASETPIWIDHALEHNGPAAVLVNLQPSPPPFFSRFERLAEVVGADEDDARAGRERFRFYRERGYELTVHDTSEWS